MQHSGTEWHKEKDNLMHYICRLYKLPQMSKNLSQTMLSRCLKFPLTQQLKKIDAFLWESGTCCFAANWNHLFRERIKNTRWKQGDDRIINYWRFQV